jgi:hypothetical protein
MDQETRKIMTSLYSNIKKREHSKRISIRAREKEKINMR